MTYRHLVPAAILLVGCQTSDATNPTPVPPVAQSIAMNSAHHAASSVEPPARLPETQLAEARRATARYRDVDRALADGYQDIDVVLPNMGRHFLNDNLLDARFEPGKPELLVYSEGERGKLTLVAVEYAIPLDLSAGAPEGFEGVGDQWFPDEVFKLWTLHAWVWKKNEDGVFHATNRRVP